MKSSYKIFFLKILLFSVPVFVFFEILFRLGYFPVITNSTCFDLKMMNVQKHHFKKIGLLSMGSSVGLYSLNSNIIVRNLNISYYNFSSWGLQMADTKILLSSFVKTYHPKYVLLASTFTDFTAPRNNSYLDYLNTDNCIKNNFPEFFYFRNYTSIHQIIRRKVTGYALNFDNWGGVSLSVKQKDINRDKWNEHDIFPTKYTQGNYKQLDSLCTFLKEQKIKFIFVQTPIKKSYTNTASSKQIINSHFDRCRSIVERQDGMYFNYYNTSVFTDRLFIDQYHLQDTGSVILTKEIVADLKKIIHQ